MNEVIWAVALAGVLATLAKLVGILVSTKSLKWHDLIVTGGMPSTHSAFVVSLSTIIYLVEGLSTSFVISIVLAVIVMRDAFGVRRSVGNEGKAIEKLFKAHKIKSKFHYSIGHTPLQVTVGSIIGAVVSFLVYFI